MTASPMIRSSATRSAMTRWQFARFLMGWPFYIMLTLMVIEALLGAFTTYLVIQAGRNVANEEFLLLDLVWILGAQSTSYAVGAVSWIFAEQAGIGAFGRYMLRFTRDNRNKTKLLHDKPVRETVEPFLTSGTFWDIFQLMYELESQLKLLLSLVFNAIVLGMEIDAVLPVAYASVFAVLLTMQWVLRKPVARAYLNNQAMTNRVTAHGYTAWDNIFSGNRYNLRLWLAGFKVKLRDCLRAQIKEIVAREGLSATSGIIGLIIVFSTMVFVAANAADDTGLLIGLAATLPRQIEMTREVHQLASEWNDLVAVWTRISGVVASMHPEPDSKFDDRIKFDQLTLRQGDRSDVCTSVEDALRIIDERTTGRVNVRGPNGSGKSTLLVTLKTRIKNRAYYWPTADRLTFAFAQQAGAADDAEDGPEPPDERKTGFSSGERQIRSLREIVEHTDASIYLLDEWDANLDPKNRAMADALIEKLAARARVVEISHRDRL
jgi:ABC-type multidrug transport system fused ATPase/permease subunit